MGHKTHQRHLTRLPTAEHLGRRVACLWTTSRDEESLQTTSVDCCCTYALKSGQLNAYQVESRML